MQPCTRLHNPCTRVFTPNSSVSRFDCNVCCVAGHLKNSCVGSSYPCTYVGIGCVGSFTTRYRVVTPITPTTLMLWGIVFLFLMVAPVGWFLCILVLSGVMHYCLGVGYSVSIPDGWCQGVMGYSTVRRCGVYVITHCVSIPDDSVLHILVGVNNTCRYISAVGIISTYTSVYWVTNYIKVSYLCIVFHHVEMGSTLYG